MMKIPGVRRGLKTAGAAAIACAASVLVLGPLAFRNRIPAFGDNVSFWAPSTAFWTAEVADGRLPLWNPYILGGVPFAADINHGLFYPPNWLPAVLGAPRSLALLALFHVALAAFGMYLFLKSEEVPAGAAVWGGVAFAFSTSLLPLVNHIVMLESMSYLPLALFAASRLAKGGGWKASLMLGLFLALSALAGDVHAAYIAALAAAAYVATACVISVIDGEAKKAGAAAGLFALAGLAALVLSAAAVMPAAQLVNLTTRAQDAGGYAAYHGLDPKAAAGIVAPAFWGSLREGNVWNFRWDNGVYLGLPLLALAVWAARRFRRGLAGYILVLFGAGLAFGSFSPLWRLAQLAFPAFRMFRQPREYFIIAVAGVILLAAHGVSDMAVVAVEKGRRRGAAKRSRGDLRPWLLVPAGLLFVAGAAALIFGRSFAAHTGGWMGVGPENRAAAAGACAIKSFGIAALGVSLVMGAFVMRRFGRLAVLAASLSGAVVLGDFAYSSTRQIVYGSPRLYGPGGALAAAVRAGIAESGAARFVPVGPDFGEYFAAFAKRNVTGGMPDEMDSFSLALALKDRLVDNEPVYTGLESALGYSTFLSRRYVALYEIATGVPQRSPVRLKGVPNADWRLLGAGAVLISSPPWREPRMSQLQAPPAIFMAHDWRPAASFKEAVELVRADRQRALSSPVVEGPDRAPGGGAPAYAAHSIENVRKGTNSLSLLVHTDRPGLLIILDNNYPGWKAYDNGIETDIVTANLTFRAVQLASGKHEVKFVFRPKTVYAGIAVSLAAFAAAAAGLIAAAVAAWRK